MIHARQLRLLVISAAVLAFTACGGAGTRTESPVAATPIEGRSATDDEPAQPDEPLDAGGSDAGDAAVPDPPEPEESTPAAADDRDVHGAEITGAATYDFSAVGPVVQNFVDDNGLNGAGLIVVHRNDGVIHHQHWGDFDEGRVSLIASSSKMITAGVLLRLDDDDLLDIDAPVADVVEWGAANPDITPAQLISNSSGLVGLLPNPAYLPYLCQYLPNGTLQACAEAIFTTPDDDADIVRPDVEFRYGGAQWQVAGAVAEAASGRSWAQLIDEIYVQPCGLDALGYNNHLGQLASGGFGYPAAFNADPSTLSATENPNMEAGAYVTTGDYGALLLMHLRDGTCGETQVLSPTALDRMHGDRIKAAYDGDAWEPGTGYGMGWWVDRDSGRISDGGAYGSVPWLDLEDGYGAYLVIEADSQLGNTLAEQLYELVDDAVTSATKTHFGAESD